ncbi:MAG: hypothetical protein KGL39_34320 [Patescibacteria group bacterium]|nr:hypothetical protein [Patescibacteria group bacterium]
MIALFWIGLATVIGCFVIAMFGIFGLYERLGVNSLMLRIFDYALVSGCVLMVIGIVSHTVYLR